MLDSTAIDSRRLHDERHCNGSNRNFSNLEVQREKKLQRGIKWG